MAAGADGGGIIAAAIALTGVFLPAAAHAHASERMTILTLPTGLSITGAALTVALTALVASMAARLPDFPARKLGERGVWLPENLLSLLSAALLWLLIAVGLFGSRDPLGNLLPLTIWTALWIALPLACVVFGDLWRPISPWTGPVRILRRLIGRTGDIGLHRLGHLPAVAGYFGFAWLEIISLRPDDPAMLAKVAAGYWLVIFVLAMADGETWLQKGEAFTVFFGLISRIAPLWRAQNGNRITIMAGAPGAQVLRMAPLPPGAIAFVTLVLAAVTFDGLADTFWWLARIGINPLEFPGRSAVVQVNTLGLLGVWAMTATTILGAIWLGLRLAGQNARFAAVVGPQMLSFLPIAAGYHIAHYLVALLTQGQYLIVALNDPLGRGWTLLGLPHRWESFGFLADRFWVQMIWGAQVAIILAAHLLAVLLSLRLLKRADPGLAGRAHLPVTLLMVTYTVLGLWLLSTATGA